MSEELEACVRTGGIAVFPADTVYGLACDVTDRGAIDRLYALKGRDPGKPAAVMYFSVAAAAPVLDALAPRTAAAVRALVPGPVTLLVPDPASDGTLGLRVPDLPALAGVGVPVLQTSANLAGGPDPVRLADVPAAIRAGADLVLDGGALPGISSTVVDLARFEDAGAWSILREGALPAPAVAAALGAR